MNDVEIYSSDEYKARIERAYSSLRSFHSELEAISAAAESMAYWQMRTTSAEQFLYELGHEEFRRPSNREDI